MALKDAAEYESEEQPVQNNESPDDDEIIIELDTISNEEECGHEIVKQEAEQSAVVLVEEDESNQR